MKILATFFCAVSLSACISPNYSAAKHSEFTRANYEAVDKLIADTRSPIDKNTPLLVATIVNLDGHDQSPRFGRLISEQVASRLTQLGFVVNEMKLDDGLYIQKSTGEILLSPDVRERSINTAPIVVTGNYAVASGYVYLTLKVLNLSDDRVITAINYVLPMTDNTQELLAPSR